MHDEMLTLLDDCLDRLSRTRTELAVARPVHAGARRAAVENAIVVAETFAVAATRVIDETRVPA